MYENVFVALNSIEASQLVDGIIWHVEEARTHHCDRKTLLSPNVSVSIAISTLYILHFDYATFFVYASLDMPGTKVAQTLLIIYNVVKNKK